MVSSAAKKMKPLQVGDNVTVHVPDVDVGRAEFKKVMGVAVNADDGFYRVGTLDANYLRNELDYVSENFIAPADVPTVSTSLRSVAKTTSMGSGQGFVRCNCTTKSDCRTNRCKCRVASVLCNSKCHQSGPCGNK